ncbi:MAG: hypothetical protein EA392_05720 [Cryomorphaceae bacterium]|nr:MAG: hypothetical protein EA392_05720 [Cryomorphaceae bacterium]
MAGKKFRPAKVHIFDLDPDIVAVRDWVQRVENFAKLGFTFSTMYKKTLETLKCFALLCSLHGPNNLALKGYCSYGKKPCNC